MRKIGICTLFYKNRNYGANLQAYALQRVVASMGENVEVISYRNCTKLHGIISDLKGALINRDAVRHRIEERDAAIDRFNNAIPHSKLYYSNTVDKLNDEYDCYITGSDQVWNPAWINPFMSLEFADPEKLTIAYAASTGRVTLNEVEKVKLGRALSSTKWISIREKESIPALKALTDKTIEYVLDPTLLLDAKEWDAVATERLIEEKYLFCYFLGDNANIRKVACEYAKYKGLKVVTLPYLGNRYREADDGFGDYALYDISPNDFISLIKFANFVMTDSFHATVFAHHYKRDFIVSGGGKNEMGCRMVSLTELFGTETRYIPEHEEVTIEKIKSLESMPVQLNLDNYNETKRHSIDFLAKALKQ